MLAQTQRAIKLALKLGADEAEAFASSNAVTTIRIAGGKVAEAKQVRAGGIGVRTVIGKKVGFHSGNEFSDGLVKQSLVISRAKPPNPRFNGFTSPRKAKGVPGIYDRKLETLAGNGAVELAETMLQAAMDFDKRIVEASGALNLVTERCAVSNSNGVQATDKTSKIFGHLTVTAEGTERSEGLGWLGSTSLKKFDPELVGEEAAEFAVRSLGASSAKPGTYDVIFEPAAAAEIFYHVLSYGLNGSDVYDRISYFTGSLGKLVAPEEVNVNDWGSMPAGLFSKTIDDEGQPTQKTPLIRKGRLVNFIYDRYYGGLARKGTTGNGLRLGDFGRSHMSEPTPGATNLVVEPGDLDRGELIEGVDKGLLLSRVWYTYPIVPQVGDFSTTSRCGFFISNGEVQGPVKQVRIHENLPRLLKQWDGVAKNQEQVFPWGASASVCTPSVRFRGVRVA